MAFSGHQSEPIFTLEEAHPTEHLLFSFELYTLKSRTFARKNENPLIVLDIQMIHGHCQFD